MRNIIYTLLLSLSFLTLFTTCKNPGIDYNTFSITEENIQPDVYSVMVSGEYDFLGEVMSMELNIGLDEQLVDAESHTMNKDNQSFSIRVDDLNPGTTYYYCYVVKFESNHKLLTEIGTFATLPLPPSDKPVVRTLEVKAVDSLAFLVTSIVDDDYGMGITERGICWGLNNNPTLNDNYVAHQENGLGEYSCRIMGLEQSTTYFVRAYAKNEMGLSYANEVLGFKTDAFEKPTVETLPIDTTGFTQTSAVCMGRILNEGSSLVIERGIYWGVSPEPDINWTYSQSNSNENDFVVILTDLTHSATYYFCAYAINNEGIGYGAIERFTTKDGRPVVRIDEVEEELSGIVVCRCFADDAGSSSIIERGVCWSTEHNPTITDNHANDGGNELGSYSVEMMGLTQGEVYYVCAYAKNSDECIGYSTEVSFEMKEIFTISVSAEPVVGGTILGGGRYFRGTPCTVTAKANAGYRLQYWVKGNELIPQDSYSFTVTSDVSFEAHFVDRPQPPVGVVDGCFTVDLSENKVWFSQGNLQYNKTTHVWSFMEHQYDMVETAGQNVGDNYADQNIVSLFGWGTSGHHDNNDPYNVNHQPWCTSKEKLFQDYNIYGYGPSHNMPSHDLTGSSANYDWGVYNQIMANGNNTVNSWRTLTIEEWEYVFDTRNASTVNGVPNARYAKARVNDIRGLILFPDSYKHPSGVEQPTSINEDTSWYENNYSATEFALMQAAGAVFLPAAGSRNGTTVKGDAGSCGHYWSVTYRDPSTAWHLMSLDKEHCNRCDGCSVRLVCPIR